MTSDELSEAVERIVEWVDSDGSWLTVTGLPGVGKREAVARALAALDPGHDLTIIDPAPAPGERPAGDGRRVIAISTEYGLHPSEAVVVVSSRPHDAAVERLAAAAERARPGEGREVERDVLEAIVASVDGHRLSLEILAEALRTTSPDALLERLVGEAADGLDPIFHHPGAGLELRRRLDRIWLSLAPHHRTLLSRCAVFAGPFALADAEAVLGVEDNLALDGLRALRVRHLIALVDGRLVVPRIVRRFLSVWRPAPDDWHIASHRRHMAAKALAALDGLGSDWSKALRALVAIEAELLAMAGETASGVADPVLCDVVLALSVLAGHRGQLERQRDLLDQAIGIAERADVEVRGRAYVLAAEAAVRVGRCEAARHWLARAAEAPRAAELEIDRLRIATMERLRSLQPAEAVPLAEACLDAARAARRPSVEAEALQLLGASHNLLYRPGRAVGPLKAACTYHAHSGSTRALVIARMNLHISYRLMGEIGKARELASASLEDAEAAGLVLEAAQNLFYLGFLSLVEGRVDAARDDLSRAWDACTRLDYGLALESIGPALAHGALEAGNLERATGWLEALGFSSDGASPGMSAEAPARSPGLVVDVLCCRALIALAAGDPDEAHRLAASAVERCAAGTMHAERLVHTLTLHAELGSIAGHPASARDSWARAARFVETTELPPLACLVGLTELRVASLDTEAQLRRLVEGLDRIRQSWWVRRALRSAWATLPREVRREARARSLHAAPSLVFDTEVRAVRLPDGQWVDFGPRRLLWSMLLCVAERPGAVSADDVVATVWPGEVMHPEAATNRLHNALSLIRKAGLRDILRRNGDSYGVEDDIIRVVLEPACIEDPASPPRLIGGPQRPSRNPATPS